MRVISKRKLYTYASLSPGFSSGRPCVEGCLGVHFLHIPSRWQHDLSWAANSSGIVNRGSLGKGRALWYYWGSALLLWVSQRFSPLGYETKVSASAIIFRLCFVPSTFALISFSFSQNPSPWFTEQWTSRSHSFFFFFLRFGEKKGLFVYSFSFDCAGSLLLCVGFL